MGAGSYLTQHEVAGLQGTALVQRASVRRSAALKHAQLRFVVGRATKERALQTSSQPER